MFSNFGKAQRGEEVFEAGNALLISGSIFHKFKAICTEWVYAIHHHRFLGVLS
ncbi:Uncharacterised protein [Vibrio cholerae]|nr:Uncharacterised protein [Vibrio cholerae]